MVKKYTLQLLAVVLFVGMIQPLKADEGMWLPLFLKKLNEADMKKKGLKLSADDLYNINKSSLKDAIVSFGGFCTGEIISKDGLILTNHHCGYESIQKHSSVKNDYLTDGFWAMKREDELPNEGLFVDFLQRIDDVTPKVLAAIKEGATESERKNAVSEVIKTIVADATKDNKLVAYVRPMFDGNEYYLFLYERYKDIRLVGAPPSAIGKFGGDTDNWMWPRHTGDFSMFRVYAGKDNKPADYSKENVPLKPKWHLPISLKGVKKNDFSMIFGYPGRTDRYLTSFGVKQAVDIVDPFRVKIRAKKLAIMKEDMDADAAIRIKYAANYAQVSNYWKFFIGEARGLKRLNVAGQKEAEEAEFQKWADADATRKAKYGSVLSNLSSAFDKYKDFRKAEVIFSEAGIGASVNLASYYLYSIAKQLETDSTISKPETKQAIEGLKQEFKELYNDYNLETDKKIYAAMLSFYKNELSPESQPTEVKALANTYYGRFDQFANEAYSKSILATQEKLNAFLEKPSMAKLNADPIYKVFTNIFKTYQQLGANNTASIKETIDKNNRLLVAGMREMNAGKKVYYPNANSTMRCTYGNLDDYKPGDAIQYSLTTTLDGIIEKEDPTNEEFIVPAKLKTLWKNKDYGQYAENGTVPVAFISNNDITGGNSGSPVINGNGELIGCAFDGNWEAMSGNIAFEPKLQRTISVDIRYVLFIIEKYAGAKHLVDEMTLVKPSTSAPVKAKAKKS